MHTVLNPGDGRRIAYEKTAEKSGGLSSRDLSPGVIFFSGFKSDMSGSKASALMAHCRERGRACIRFDYTGHGASSGAFEEGSIGDWRRDALDVFDALAEGPQVLVGSSMGAWIALLVARERKERVAGFVGIASAPDFTEDLIWNAATAAQKAELLEKGRFLVPDCYGGAPYPITRRLVEEGREHLLMRGSIPLSVPARLLHGTADADVPWQTSAALMDRLESEDVRLTLIKGGDHRLSGERELRLICESVEELIALRK